MLEPTTQKYFFSAMSVAKQLKDFLGLNFFATYLSKTPIFFFFFNFYSQQAHGHRTSFQIMGEGGKVEKKKAHVLFHTYQVFKNTMHVIFLVQWLPQRPLWLAAREKCSKLKSAGKRHSSTFQLSKLAYIITKGGKITRALEW